MKQFNDLLTHVKFLHFKVTCHKNVPFVIFFLRLIILTGIQLINQHTCQLPEYKAHIIIALIKEKKKKKTRLTDLYISLIVTLFLIHGLPHLFYYYHWVVTSYCRLLVPEGIIRPVVSISSLIRFIGYICLKFTFPK